MNCFEFKPADITFLVGGQEVIVLKSNGDIHVKGKLVENDKEVVDGLRELLKLAKQTNTTNENRGGNINEFRSSSRSVETR
ncbi:hypothetical protein K7H05_00920 [Bacillus sp. ZZQ-131]|uniref:Uncharacterized protein n=2 Tax=root TaxID=1 RepID=A0A0A7AR10_9CAUD|nr:hypothetical protein [Bacillus thuringiensis]YP_009194047.1 hypothetical protein BMBtpLA_73 [Bacillus phage vB_BtS_BMBtp3]MDA2112321.1 hypothetical protein [Bacillus cereus]AHC73187.1 hypothetical protein P165_00150 [Bacillus thuringiensis serovar tenebrionis str. YBT-1765]AHJ86778.1 hypothetical protein BMBtpLA_73 [Bacillus phage vB_BtS_BMBtp3]MDA2129576.1 hypothetical protein [Bacillus cereus]MEB9162589.1 hypothetical protein [Bacillus cereus]